MVKKFALYHAWLIVGLMVALSLFVRFRLRDMPLERDEGEYAYAGQLMLQGIPPYKEAYNMKLPGTYAAYAVGMAVFGQTPSGVHLTVALVNAASIVLMYLLARRILDEPGAIAATVSFNLLSLSPSVLGLAGHATHFVVLPALGGMLLLLKAVQSPKEEKSEIRNSKSESNPKLESEKEDRNTPRYQPSTIHTTIRNANVTIGAANRWRAWEANQLFLSGLLFGLAFLMKQHGVFFGLFGGLYLLWTRIAEVQSPKSKVQGRRVSSRSRSGFKFQVSNFKFPLRGVGFYALGCVLPYALTCLALWAVGVFPQFWFWTVSYASKYAAGPLANASESLKVALSVVVGPNTLLWLLPVAGAVWMWWIEDPASSIQHPASSKNLESRSTHASRRSQTKADHEPVTPKSDEGGSRPVSNFKFQISNFAPVPSRKFLLAAFFLCSFASSAVGFKFREHYFITLLPALSLLTGLVLSRALHVLKYERTLELFVAIPILCLVPAAAIVSLAGNGSVWFPSSADKASVDVYHTTIFSETAKMAEYIRDNTPKQARIAVIGSEPEIYFLSRRHAATGYIYTYPLVENQPYARKMQDQMISEIETNHPEYFVYVNDELSWAPAANSDNRIFDWWRDYWARNLELISTVPIKQPAEENSDTANTEPIPAKNSSGDAKRLLLLKRKENR